MQINCDRPPLYNPFSSYCKWMPGTQILGRNILGTWILNILLLGKLLTLTGLIMITTAGCRSLNSNAPKIVGIIFLIIGTIGVIFGIYLVIKAKTEQKISTSGILPDRGSQIHENEVKVNRSSSVVPVPYYSKPMEPHPEFGRDAGNTNFGFFDDDPEAIVPAPVESNNFKY